MDKAAARATPEMLDAIQVARGRVPIGEFRLKPDCVECVVLAREPVSDVTNVEIRVHVTISHADEIL